MKAEEILKMRVKDVKGNICVALFNVFAKHFNASTEVTAKAWNEFNELSEMDITLGLALSTAFAVAKL